MRDPVGAYTLCCFEYFAPSLLAPLSGGLPRRVVSLGFANLVFNGLHLIPLKWLVQKVIQPGSNLDIVRIGFSLYFLLSSSFHLTYRVSRRTELQNRADAKVMHDIEAENYSSILQNPQHLSRMRPSLESQKALFYFLIDPATQAEKLEAKLAVFKILVENKELVQTWAEAKDQLLETSHHFLMHLIDHDLLSGHSFEKPGHWLRYLFQIWLKAADADFIDLLDKKFDINMEDPTAPNFHTPLLTHKLTLGTRDSNFMSVRLLLERGAKMDECHFDNHFNFGMAGFTAEEPILFKAVYTACHTQEPSIRPSTPPPQTAEASLAEFTQALFPSKEAIRSIAARSDVLACDLLKESISGFSLWDALLEQPVETLNLPLAEAFLKQVRALENTACEERGDDDESIQIQVKPSNPKEACSLQSFYRANHAHHVYHYLLRTVKAYSAPIETRCQLVLLFGGKLPFFLLDHNTARCLIHMGHEKIGDALLTVLGEGAAHCRLTIPVPWDATDTPEVTYCYRDDYARYSILRYLAICAHDDPRFQHFSQLNYFEYFVKKMSTKQPDGTFTITLPGNEWPFIEQCLKSLRDGNPCPPISSPLDPDRYPAVFLRNL